MARNLKKEPFDSFSVEYGITNPLGKDLARINFYWGQTQVGRALFGEAIAPGQYASVETDGSIALYFPTLHFQNIIHLLQSGSGLVLFVEFGDAHDDHFRGGGIMMLSES